MFDNNEDHPLYDNEQVNQRDAISWILIIFTGVLLANLATLTVIKLYLNYEADQLIKELKNQSSIFKESQRIQQIQNSKALNEIKNEAINRQLQIKKNIELCNFWTKEIAKNNSVRNQELKRRACNR